MSASGLVDVAPEDIRDVLMDLVATYVERPVAEVRTDTPLTEYGLDSVYALAVCVDIEERLGICLDPTIMWDYPTIDSLAGAIGRVRSGTGAEQAVARYLPCSRLLEETLPADITPGAGVRPASVGPFENALITGATGFTGAHLLRALLDQGLPTVYALVRAEDGAGARQRVRENLSRYGLWHVGDEERVIGVAGELGPPRFGLSEQAYDDLAEQVELIVHVAATVNFLLPYAALREVNVEGTLEILRLACRGRIKPVHYMSSMGLLPERLGPQMFPETPASSPEDVYGSYRQTKWVADRLVNLAAERGVPTAVYRPGNITGPLDTGVCPDGVFVNALIIGCIQLGAALDFGVDLFLVPVDFLGAAVARCALSTTVAAGTVFNLPGAAPVGWNDLVDMINDCGRPVRRLPYRDWYRLLCDNAHDNALAPYLPLFEEDAPGRELGVAGNKPTVSAENMTAQIAGSGITCREFDRSALETQLRFLVSTGRLPGTSA